MNLDSHHEAEAAEWAAVARARSGLYGLLAIVYLKPPSKILFSRDFQFDLDMIYNVLSSHFTLPLDVTEGFSQVKSRLETHVDDVEDALAQMRVEFTTLFRGVKRDYSPPPPYESVYLEGHGLVMGEATQQVLDCYRKAGLTLPRNHENEPPDHIGFELDFMRYLCEKESREHQSRNDEAATLLFSEEYAFLKQHLSLWGSSFCDTVLSNATSEFYCGIVKLTKGFLALDAAYLSSVVA